MALTIDNRSWYTIETEQENRQMTQLLRMTAAEWKAEGQRIIRTWHGRDIRPCLDYLNRMDRERADYAEEMEQSVVVHHPQSQFEIDFSAWQDMIEEPWKYGDSIVEWLDIDATLTAGPGRWRVGAYWSAKQAEADAEDNELVAPWRALYSRIAREAAIAGDRAWVRRDVKRHAARFRAEAAKRTALRTAAATRIAAAVRGHQARTASPHLNCCMCLSHRICPLQTDVGMMCLACAEQGPYEDNTGPLDDPWNWSRAVARK